MPAIDAKDDNEPEANEAVEAAPESGNPPASDSAPADQPAASVDDPAKTDAPGEDPTAEAAAAAEPTASDDATTDAPTKEPTASAEATTPTEQPTTSDDAPADEPTSEPTAEATPSDDNATPGATPDASPDAAGEPTSEPTAEATASDDDTPQPDASPDAAEEPTTSAQATTPTEQPTAGDDVTAEAPAEEPKSEPESKATASDDDTAQPDNGPDASAEEPTSEPASSESPATEPEVGPLAPGASSEAAEEVAAPATAVLVDERPTEPIAPPPPPPPPPDTDLEPRHTPRRSKRRQFALVAVPLVVVAVLSAGWAIDSNASSGEVGRNVDLAGRSIGGLGDAELREVTAELAVSLTERPVTIQSGDRTYESTAAALGLSLDQDATVEAALDVGRDGSPLTRPFRWVASWFTTREVASRYALDEAQTAASLEALQGPDRVAPVEPGLQLVDTGLTMTPGQDGSGIAAGAFADELLEAAEGSDEGPLVIETEPERLAPRFKDADVQALADQANAMTATGIGIRAAAVNATVPPEVLRSWIGLAPAPPGDDVRPDLAINGDAVKMSLPGLVGAVGEAAVNATVTLDEATGVPVVVPGRDGVTCCGDDSGARIFEALKAGQPQVDLDVTVAEPEFTTAEVQAWGITQAIGGSRAWQSGHEVPGPGPGFTTYHDCCAARVRNIQRLADLVRGAVIPPGGDFSINDYVGPRTAAKGFVLAGAIAQGQHVDEIGGGVSQFATTTFNAAYFAGLDITKYQAHSEWFSRYPRGREATMGYPNPDLAIHNNTPYGLMIWTSYTGTSLTVTFYSTPWATAEQTGISEGRAGACRVVVTTRTRWFPDGTATEDQFSATYRPGEGQFC